MFDDLMQKFVRWLDPKLEKYRMHHVRTRQVEPAKPVKYTPRTVEDFIGVLQRTPKNVLSGQDRARIAAVMSFDERKVSDIMVPKSEMMFVKTTDMLGPLVLDKLYKSGFTSFPVVDSRGKVKGIIRTEALNALEIKKTDRADKYLDTVFNYLHSDDSLSQAVEQINRLGSQYFLVLDAEDELAGFFTVEILLDYLLGR